MKFETDPLKEMLRQQRYKELADRAIGLLRGLKVKDHEYYHLLAQSYHNRWEYAAAVGSMEEAIRLLPAGSYLRQPYERFRGDILRKRARFGRQT